MSSTLYKTLGQYVANRNLDPSVITMVHCHDRYYTYGPDAMEFRRISGKDNDFLEMGGSFFLASSVPDNEIEIYKQQFAIHGVTIETV